MENAQYYRSLSRNLVSIVIVVSFTPLLLIAALIGYSFETSYKGKSIAYLKETVKRNQQNIDVFLSEKLDYLKVLSRSYTFEELTDEKFLARKLAILQDAYGGVFVDLGVVNSQGIQVAYAGMFKLERADYSKAEWFKTAMKRTHFISDVFLGLRRSPHFIVSIKHNWRGEDYILRATVDFVQFNSLVENVRIGETGHAFIMNRAGEFQTKVGPETEANREFYMALLQKNGLKWEDGGLDAVSGVPSFTYSYWDSPYKEIILTGEGRRGGDDFVYIMTPLKSGEWVLVFQQDKSDAFRDLRRARFLALAILLLGGASIAVTAILVSRKMVSRIEMSDREKEMMNEQVIETGKLASVGELAAGIAHEINNPVAIMVEEAGWIEDLLRDETQMEASKLEEVKRALTQINTQGERCKEITHKLLSFARRTDPRVVEVNINEVLEEILSISEQRSKFSNVKLEKNLDPDLPHIMASPSELQQVFLNLINNSLDAIGTGGGTITVTSRLADDRLVVDVADTGTGMPKAILARIFEPFFTTKPVGKGTGLGLAICYGIIKKMGGDITVNSAVGVGTTMHVYLPVPKGAVP
ncbi:MAG: two-component sensor histidine kinase [Deltaproteobacteria bacterium]|nr:two-component sensor histidine kinase [Deltaproteobacteria bacterium]